MNNQQAVRLLDFVAALEHGFDTLIGTNALLHKSTMIRQMLTGWLLENPDKRIDQHPDWFIMGYTCQDCMESLEARRITERGRLFFYCAQCERVYESQSLSQNAAS